MRVAVIVAIASLLGAMAAHGARVSPRACGVLCGDYLPAWSPDGRTIAFVHYLHAPGGPRAAIYAVPARGGAIRAVIGLRGLYPAAPGGPVGPFSHITWSPDSNWVGVSSFWANWLVPAAGGPARLLGTADSSWAPDSKQLAFATALDIGSFRNVMLVPGDVRVIGVDGSAPAVLAGTDPSAGGGRWAANPVWSPSGEIAYVTGSRPAGSRSPDTSTAEIWASRPNGSGAHRLVGTGPGTYRLLAWSEDGGTLYYTSSRADGGELWAVDRSGGAPRLLYVFGRTDVCCRVAPDGKHAAAASANLERPYRFDLVVADLSTGSARILLRDVSVDSAAGIGWSPDSTRLAFALGGECGPLSGIEVEPVAGGRATRLTEPCRRDGNARANRMLGGPGPDALYGHAGDDTIDGGPGSDFLQGGSGSDRMHGGPGNDRIYGGPGSDLIWGDSGNDTIWVRDGVEDVVRCGTGRDTVYADRKDAVAPDCEVLYRG